MSRGVVGPVATLVMVIADVVSVGCGRGAQQGDLDPIAATMMVDEFARDALDVMGVVPGWVVRPMLQSMDLGGMGAPVVVRAVLDDRPHV
jgi:hypothetical protein